MTGRSRRSDRPDADRAALETTRAAFEDMAALLDAARPAAAQSDPQLPVPALPSLLERCEALAARGTTRYNRARLLICFPGLAPLDPDFWQSRVPALTVTRLGADLPSCETPGDPARAARATAAALEVIRTDAARDGHDTLVLAEAGLTPPQATETAVTLVCHPRLAWRAHLACHGAAAQSYGAFCRRLDRATGNAEVLRIEDAGTDPGDIRTALCTRLDLSPPLRLHRRRADPALPRQPDVLPPLRPDETALHAALCARLGYDPQAALPAPVRGPAPRRVRRARSDLPNDRIVLACHHKSGTNFLRSVFRNLAQRYDLRIWMKFYDPEPAAGWDLCMHQHSRIDEVQFGRDFRGVHLVRHPMSLIYSAALYHQKCSEPWVDVPLQRFTEDTFRMLSERDTYNVFKAPDTTQERRQQMMADTRPEAVDSGYDFAGRTYRQMLEGFSTPADKLRFEMRGFSFGVVRDMARFPGDDRFFRITLEEVSHDRSMDGLERMFRHLGFGGQALQTCLDVARAQCLWHRKELPIHATTGVSRDWQTAFHGPLKAEFRALFGWPDLGLGYPDPSPPAAA